MRLLDDVKKVVWFDLSLFHGRRRLLLACLGVMLVPAAYATIYLSSTWDPYSKVSQLPVAVVNLDQPVEVRGHHVEVGAKMLEGLEEKHAFTSRPVASEDEARRLVNEGTVAFALIIPPTLSQSAMEASSQTPARIRVIYSEGNNFMGATVARRFADELARNANESLNTQRWSEVLRTVDSSRGNFEKLKDGVSRLREGAGRLDDGLGQAREGATKLARGSERAEDGAGRLDDGAQRVADATKKLTDGVTKLGGGLRQLRDAMPEDAKLAKLNDGARQVAEGQQQLTAGLDKLQAGTTKLKEGTKDIPLVGGKIAAGAGQLEAGAKQARDGSEKLANGGAQVAEGVTALTTGVSKMSAGVRTMAGKLPSDDQLAQLADGSARVADGTGALHRGLGTLSGGTRQLENGLVKLSDGAAQLSAGLQTLEAALPSSVDGLAGDAKGLAASIQPELEPLTTVGAYGNSMVPYFLGLSLWVGVVMMGFVFQLRWFPQRVRHVKRLALVLGRLAMPLVFVLGQATLLSLALTFVVGATVPSFWKLWLIAVVTSTVFLSVLVMLIGLFGDVGKVIALLFLVFQMGASGGVFPLAMTSSFFRAANPFVPFSWVLTAARAALFGAYGGHWVQPLLVLAGFGVGAIALTALLARWKFVPRWRFAPLMDV